MNKIFKIAVAASAMMALGNSIGISRADVPPNATEQQMPMTTGKKFALNPQPLPPSEGGNLKSATAPQTTNPRQRSKKGKNKGK